MPSKLKSARPARSASGPPADDVATPAAAPPCGRQPNITRRIVTDGVSAAKREKPPSWRRTTPLQDAPCGGKVSADSRYVNHASTAAQDATTRTFFSARRPPTRTSNAAGAHSMRRASSAAPSPLIALKLVSATAVLVPRPTGDPPAKRELPPLPPCGGANNTTSRSSMPSSSRLAPAATTTAKTLRSAAVTATAAVSASAPTTRLGAVTRAGTLAPARLDSL
mmetsp:Transcript_14017/g.40650  ORF Transcript_14017/g.40650 Transcript_14017/m.40650 type:complete len:223 (+) Transcript_14017:4518-5186(+)